MQIRLLPTTKQDAISHMATDEALLDLCSQNKSQPYLRFYSWSPTAVTIGYFQSAKEEVDIDFINNNNIDITRRCTGGGAVLHEDELTYSILIPESLTKEDILESYTHLCGIIIEALNNLGYSAEFSPINDILVNNKKISGNAQTRRNGWVLQHGTILLNIDKDKMFTILKVPLEKMKDKGVSIKERVSSLNEIKPITFNEVKSQLVKTFQNHFDIIPSSLTDEEMSKINELKTKYGSKEWIFKR